MLITKEDLLLEMSAFDLARLCGDDSGGTINEDRIARANEMAQNQILSRIGSALSSDEIESSNIIKEISQSLTLANLFKFANVKSILSNVVYRRENFALDILDKIAEGKIYFANSKILNKINFQQFINEPFLGV